MILLIKIVATVIISCSFLAGCFLATRNNTIENIIYRLIMEIFINGMIMLAVWV